jgi:peptidyl-prolyl cis-trans isomerase A (cyclophilin A)
MARIFSILLMNLIVTGICGQTVNKNPVVIIRTELGDIRVELYPERAPVTVANFLRYVDSSLLNNSCFYRVVRSDNQPKDSVKIAVIQGGRFQDEDKGFPPIIHETTYTTGIKHKDGVISMARGTPGTATSEFFICIGDQPELDFGGKRNKDGQGFAAFGKVIDGYDVVKKIHSISAPVQYLDKKILISSIVRAER